MKTIIKACVIAGAWLVTMPVLASGLLKDKVRITQLEEGKVQIVYSSEDQDQLQISIYNDKNQQVFREVIRNKRGFKKPYDLRKMPYGDYRVEVKSRNEKITKEITYQAPKYPGNVKISFQNVGAKKLGLKIMGPEPKDLKLHVYDDHNRLLLQEEINTMENFGKVYHFMGSRTRFVHFVLTDGKDVIESKTIRI